MSFSVSVESTAPIAGQKTGTSGLRKRVVVVSEGNYLANWLESLMLALADVDAAGLAGATLVVGGDGRYYNDVALQLIFKIAAAHGVGNVVVGQNGLFSTPAVSAIIRARKAYGGIILTASHNPGGPDGDFGIKYNVASGGPAPESLTNQILKHTESVKEIRIANDLPTIPIDKVGSHEFTGAEGAKFRVDVVDSVSEYADLLRKVFDFDALRALFARPDFVFSFDGLNGVAGPYAQRIFVDELGASAKSLKNCKPLPDFGGKHPDPNLTYAEDLVRLMEAGAFEFGAASDGDADRNMVLGKRFFVNPSDSVAVIAAHARQLPFYGEQLKAVARSMPTSGALDRVAEAIGVKLYEVPTGWKYFGNIMDHYEAEGAPNGVICGEESFGTGSSHIREKDGLWAVLAWLSIVALHNTDAAAPLVSLESIVESHWKRYGRNYFSRYDYENVSSESAAAVMATLEKLAADSNTVGAEFAPGLVVAAANNFEYTDPFDKSVASKQGMRFVFENGSRFIVRLSGTGSSGATIRLYVELYESPTGDLMRDAQEALKPIIDVALEKCNLKELTGREKPTVIT